MEGLLYVFIGPAVCGLMTKSSRLSPLLHMTMIPIRTLQPLLRTPDFATQ